MTRFFGIKTMSLLREKHPIVMMAFLILLVHPALAEDATPNLIRDTNAFSQAIHSGSEAEWILHRWETFMSDERCTSGESLTFFANGTVLREFCSNEGAVVSESSDWSLGQNTGPEFSLSVGEETFEARIRSVDSIFELRLQNQTDLKSELTSSKVYVRQE